MKERWSEQKARQWYAEKPWPVGCNYVTSDAVNDLEMWRNETFHPQLIAQELAMAADVGMNSLRVFLSFAVWQNEKEIFEQNFETFLRLAAQQHMTVVPVLFDDCAFDFGAEAVYGPQPEPVPGVHNSRWVPSPGFAIQDDPAMMSDCRAYIEAVVGKHREDERILFWNLYNEPGNTNRGQRCIPLLQNAFAWARACDPIQPLAADIWDLSNEAVWQCCARESDIFSMHIYGNVNATLAMLERMEAYHRPMMMTEWMHRPAGSTILELLPVFAEKKVGAWQWGLVQGRTQTYLAWETMNGGTPDAEPVLWQHDLFRTNGAAYRADEIAMYRRLTGKAEEA